jgi:hypothetical protein
MQSSLPQRQDHLRKRYRALLESAWGRPGAGTREPSAEPPGVAVLPIKPRRSIPGGVAPHPQPDGVPV